MGDRPQLSETAAAVLQEFREIKQMIDRLTARPLNQVTPIDILQEFREIKQRVDKIIPPPQNPQPNPDQTTTSPHNQ